MALQATDETWESILASVTLPPFEWIVTVACVEGLIAFWQYPWLMPLY